MAKQEKYDENLMVSKSEEEIKPNVNKNKIEKISDILSQEEINDTKRAYMSVGDNETKQGICKVCGKSTMYAARHLCYEHYKQFLQ